MRSVLLEAFRRYPRTQYENLKYQAAEVAAERGLPVQGTTTGQRMLLREDWRGLREEIWGLIAERVITVGMDDSNDAWPWLSVTAWGERFLAGERVTPYDTGEYRARLEAVAALDDVEELYVDEALTGFIHELPNSAAVMIGAASEHLIIVLVQAIANADPTFSSRADTALRGKAAGMVRFAQAYLEPKRPLLPRELAEMFETTFIGIASMIRIGRNDAGHPALPQVDRQRCFVLLQLYPEYRNWVHKVVALLPL